MVYDVIVIGAGPAGLFAALKCGGQDRRVLVLEKNPAPGKKLLITGSGQCNITHGGDIGDFIYHYGDNGRFLRPALYSFTNRDLLEFFKEHGLNFIENDEGKVFPQTLRAQDVLGVLVKECKSRGVGLSFNQRVGGVSKGEDGLFVVETQSNQYKSEHLVIATGGKSYPSTGSTGDGYTFARQLGHSLAEQGPALTPLYIKDYPFSGLSGISFKDINISLWRKGKKVKEWTGDVLLTHTGVSGPGILNYSRYILPGDVVKLNFLNGYNQEQFKKDLMDNLGKHGKAMVRNVLKGYPVPQRLLEKLMEMADVPVETRSSHLTKTKRDMLVEMLTVFPMEVEKLGDYHIAMATRGGVNLKEINPKTMESRLVPKLYFAGEVLDIDGDTGGYNLQAAFSTGYLAARSILQGY